MTDTFVLSTHTHTHTALTLQFVTHTFQEDHDPTIGTIINGLSSCDFWDSAVVVFTALVFDR